MHLWRPICQSELKQLVEQRLQYDISAPQCGERAESLVKESESGGVFSAVYSQLENGFVVDGAAKNGIISSS